MSDESQMRLKTTLSGIAEITALTQCAINAAMSKLVVDRPELTKVDCENKRGDSLKATIAEPQISLKVIGASRANLTYFARLGSGEVLLNYAKPLTFNTKDWVIAFNVDLEKVEVEQDSAEDKAVRAAINQPGDYSLESLYLTFNSGDIINNIEKESDFQGVQWEEDDKTEFLGLLAKWYITDGAMTDRRNRTLGYNMRANNPSSVNEEAPTFPPTSLKFQTYEYRIPGHGSPNEGIPAGDQNVLLYLQMTNGQKFPDDPSILPYTGNFASSGMDGTMAINRTIFWDSYLLRKSPDVELLQTLNHGTYVYIKHADVNNFKSPNWEIGTGDKSHSASPSYFHWNLGKPKGMSWTWEKLSKDNGSDDEQNHDTELSFAANKQSGNAYGRLYVDCNVKNQMSTSAGSNVITATGSSDIRVESDCGSGSWISNWSAYFRIHVWLDWEVTITINAVDSGGLDIVVDLDEDKFKVNSDPVEYQSAGGYGVSKEEVLKKQDGLAEDLKKALRNSDLHTVADKLRSNLNDAARFVVPGLGVFKYKDPMFNNDGDLFISIGYQ